MKTFSDKGWKSLPPETFTEETTHGLTLARKKVNPGEKSRTKAMTRKEICKHVDKPKWELMIEKITIATN